jgi:AbrB family looped-hinge helix DNA binding protein
MQDKEVIERKVQQKGRVDVPNELWESLSISIGERILVYEDAGKVIIRPARVEELR